MASRQQIKQRIGSVKSTKQITKAMQLVAASKLRRAQDAVAGPRAYASLAREILVRLRANTDGESESYLFEERPVKNRLLIVITSDRGLAGAYNSNVIRRMIGELKEDRDANVKTSVVTIGKQAGHAASRIQGIEVKGIYQDLPDKPDADTLRPILNTVVGLFADGQVDAVDIINTKFVSTVVQEVQVARLLPAGVDAKDDDVDVREDLAAATVEPSAEVLLRSVTIRLLDAQIYQALLEAAASEHSMRMLAMKNATDNASDIIDDLTLEYNNARQAAITQELAEITGGAEAMK
ncbi:MAG TPA: ATP synthase F1 subunit gamma [Candidatus Saccharimonadales bacterium]|nr:ATP synthase F1 subunit gamma [Candidatus Saccharimonadales bacterium]